MSTTARPFDHTTEKPLAIAVTDNRAIVMTTTAGRVLYCPSGGTSLVRTREWMDITPTHVRSVDP